VDHDAGVGEAVALFGGAAAEEEGAHAGGLADADGGDWGMGIQLWVPGDGGNDGNTFRLDIGHAIIYCQTRRHAPSRRVDVEVDGLFGVVCFEEEELSDD